MKFFTTSNSKNIIATLRIVTIEKSELAFLKPWIKRRKNLGFYGTLLVELHLEDEYDFNILFTNDFWKFWRNILADKRWHNSREYYNKRTNPAQTITCSHKWFLSTWELYTSYVYEYYSFYSIMNSLTCISFCPFVLLIFPSLISSRIFYFRQKRLIKQTNHLIWAPFITLDFSSK